MYTNEADAEAVVYHGGGSIVSGHIVYSGDDEGVIEAINYLIDEWDYNWLSNED